MLLSFLQFTYADLLLGVSLLLFEKKGPDFFLHAINKTEREEQ